MEKALVKLQTVYGRGVNFFGQIGLNNGYKAAENFTPIPGLEKIQCKSIHASYAQSLCVLDNGEILTWGWPLDVRSQMQILIILQNNPRLAKFVQRYSPFPKISLREGKDFPQKDAALLSECEEISIGGAFVLARDSEGRGYAWGNNHRGQCATDDFAFRAKPTMINSLLDKYIIKVAAGYQHSLFLTHDGEVWATGRVGNFSFGKPPLKEVTHMACVKRMVKMKLHGIIEIAAGQNHSVFIDEVGRLLACGKNDYGQCGQVSSSRYIEEPTEVYMPEKCIKVCCGTKHTLALGESGTLYGFGAKMYGQLDGFRDGVDHEQAAALPIKLLSSSKVVKIFAGFEKSGVILKNGETWIWGGMDLRYLEGEFFDEMTLVNPLIPKSKDTDIVDIGLGYMHTLITTSM